MSDRICVIHIGTHKTGTTSLQYFLQSNSATLEECGVAFSRVGWYGVVPGNHHIAWDLVGNRFNGAVAAFAEELRTLQSPSMILSAEDFSLLHEHPTVLSRFVALIRDAGFTPKVLAYLRPQPEFAESMYAERVKHGDVLSFDSYLDTIATRGRYDMSGAAIEFRYEQLLDTFAEAVGKNNVIARAYYRPSNDLAIFHDFLAALEQLIPAFRAGGLNLQVSNQRINESLTFGSLLRTAFIGLHPGEPTPDDANEFLSRWAPEVSPDLFNSRFALLTERDVARLGNAFQAHNETLSLRYGVDFTASSLQRQDVASVERAILERCLATWSV